MPAVSVLVVTTQPEGEGYANDLAGLMADRFGGVSVYQGQGVYRGADGMLVRDTHSLVKTFVDPWMWNDVTFQWVRDQADQLRVILGEECVAVVFEPHSTMEFVQRDCPRLARLMREPSVFERQGEERHGRSEAASSHGSATGEHAEVLRGAD